jgi:dUTP pyrophosphatase
MDASGNCIIYYTNKTPYNIQRATKGSVGFDLCSPQTCTIKPGETQKINSGIVLYFQNFEQYAQILSRSGLACLHGIEVDGSGIIDPDYTKEVIVQLKNTKDREYTVYAGDRICQMVFKPFHRVTLEQIQKTKVVTLTNKKRIGGFGSTGK